MAAPRAVRLCIGLRHDGAGGGILIFIAERSPVQKYIQMVIKGRTEDTNAQKYMDADERVAAKLRYTPAHRRASFCIHV